MELFRQRLAYNGNRGLNVGRSKSDLVYADKEIRLWVFSALTVCFNTEDAEITQRAAEKAQNKKVLTGILATPIVTEVMISTRTFFYFAFTYRFFFNEESGPAKFESDVLKT
jgi:hypothetical protein